MDDVELHSDIDNLAQLGDALAEHEVELASAEGWGHLVLHDAHLDAVADVLVAVLDGLGAADVDTHRSVELQGVAAGGGLGVAEEDTYLLAQLVDEDAAAVGLADGGGELAHGLAHQAGLQAYLAVTHVAVNLGLGCQGCHRVDDDDVDGAGTDEVVGYLESLLAVVGLRHQEVIHIDSQLLGIETVEGMLGIDEGRYAAFLLALGDGMDGQGGLTARLGTVDLDDAAARQAAHAQRIVKTDGARRDDVDLLVGTVAQLHDGALAIALLYLVQRALEHFQLLQLQGIGVGCFFSHNVQLFSVLLLMFALYQ